MKYQITLDDKPSHCLHCQDKSLEDNCVLQTDKNGYPIEFENWKKQRENCPIKEVKSC